VKRARPVFLAQARASHVSFISSSVKWLVPAPQVIRQIIDVIDPHELEALVEGLLIVLKNPARRLGLAFLSRLLVGSIQRPRLLLEVGEAEVHLVAASLEGLAVGLDFEIGAGVDVIDAALDAARDHLVAVLLEVSIVELRAQPAPVLEQARHDRIDPLPMPAQANGRERQVRLSAAAVLHCPSSRWELAKIGPQLTGPFGKVGQEARNHFGILASARAVRNTR
jgi:hypothetical protein